MDVQARKGRGRRVERTDDCHDSKSQGVVSLRKSAVIAVLQALRQRRLLNSSSVRLPT